MLYCKRIDDSHDRRAVQHSEGISLLINAVRSEYGIMITESDISYGKLGKHICPSILVYSSVSPIAAVWQRVWYRIRSAALMPKRCER